MSKKKKTPFELMAREFAFYMPITYRGERKSAEGWMEYYKEKAGTPDGGDAIRDEIKELRNIRSSHIGSGTGISPDEEYGLQYLEMLCDKYGIEVKNNADTTAK